MTARSCDKAALARLVGNHRICRAALFGSALKGTGGPMGARAAAELSAGFREEIGRVAGVRFVA